VSCETLFVDLDFQVILTPKFKHLLVPPPVSDEGCGDYLHNLHAAVCF
jgi:hypothetical protein